MSVTRSTYIYLIMWKQCENLPTAPQHMVERHKGDRGHHNYNDDHLEARQTRFWFFWFFFLHFGGRDCGV